MNSQSSEIEIGTIFKNTLMKLIFFFKKNFSILLILIILGIGVGYSLNPLFKSYESKVIIAPNYSSVDYIYNEIDLINSRIADRDSIFLNKIGITKDIKKIEIKPINNIYQFVQESDSNFELLKLFAEDGDINKVAEDETTSKNYKTHQIILSTNLPRLNSNDINKLLAYLNNNNYYKKIKDISIKNEKVRLNLNEKTIDQINSVFSKFDAPEKESNKNLVYVNENNQINDLLVTKRDLMKENEYIKLNEVLTTNIVTDISQSLNIQTKSKNSFLAILFPILFIGIFLSYKLLFTKQKNS